MVTDAASIPAMKSTNPAEAATRGKPSGGVWRFGYPAMCRWVAGEKRGTVVATEPTVVVGDLVTVVSAWGTARLPMRVEQRHYLEDLAQLPALAETAGLVLGEFTTGESWQDYLTALERQRFPGPVQVVLLTATGPMTGTLSPPPWLTKKKPKKSQKKATPPPLAGATAPPAGKTAAAAAATTKKTPIPATTGGNGKKKPRSTTPAAADNAPGTPGKKPASTPRAGQQQKRTPAARTPGQNGPTPPPPQHQDTRPQPTAAARWLLVSGSVRIRPDTVIHPQDLPVLQQRVTTLIARHQPSLVARRALSPLISALLETGKAGPEALPPAERHRLRPHLHIATTWLTANQLFLNRAWHPQLLTGLRTHTTDKHPR